MQNLAKIKNKKLQKLLEKSLKFQALSGTEQKKQIKEIAACSEKEQGEYLCPFFEDENQKEESLLREKKNRAFAILLDKIAEIDHALKKMVIEDRENAENADSNEEQSNLLNKLNQIS